MPQVSIEPPASGHQRPEERCLWGPSCIDILVQGEQEPLRSCESGMTETNFASSLWDRDLELTFNLV